VTAIAHTPAEAQAMYQRFRDVLDEAASEAKRIR
jgi:hypothetical protein